MGSTRRRVRTPDSPPSPSSSPRRCASPTAATRASVLNQELSPRWKMFTPPYVLLLIRTFLTLEGIADRVDPDFNIYEMAMPWAIRRSLSPKTVDGIAAMRSTFLTPDNRVQWERLLDVASSATTDDADDADAANAAATAAAAGLADAAAAAAPQTRHDF